VPVKPEILSADEDRDTPHLTNRETLKLPLIKTSCLAFFCYCGYESSMIMWISSYVNEIDGLSAAASALFSSIFFMGITGGRLISGFLSVKIGMKNLARYGCVLALTGMIIIFLPFGKTVTGIGISLVGTGAGPFYPALMYRTPEIFGRKASGSAIGLQMAFAYTGSTLVPLFFGILPLEIFPVLELVLISITFALSESLNYRKKTMKPL
jgi:fucose permease